MHWVSDKKGITVAQARLTMTAIDWSNFGQFVNDEMKNENFHRCPNCQEINRNFSKNHFLQIGIFAVFICFLRKIGAFREILGEFYQILSEK